MYLQHLTFVISSKTNAHESLQLPALCGLVLHLFIEPLPPLLRILNPSLPAGWGAGVIWRGGAAIWNQGLDQSSSVGGAWNNALGLFGSLSGSVKSSFSIEKSVSSYKFYNGPSSPLNSLRLFLRCPEF